MSSFHGLSQYSQVSQFPRRPRLTCTLTFDERLRCKVTRQALQHITPFSRPPKIILYKFRCRLFITFPSSRASPSPRVPRPRVPASHVPESQSHVLIILLVTARRTRNTEIQGRCGFGLQRNVQRNGRKEKNRYILMLTQSLWWSKEIENNQWQGVMKE